LTGWGKNRNQHTLGRFFDDLGAERAATLTHVSGLERDRTGYGRVMGQPASEELAQTFAEIARELQAEGTAERTLKRICTTAVQTVPGCDHSGVTLIRHGKVDTPAASDDVPTAVDAIQYEVGEGPCLEAIKDQEIFLTADLAAEHRWPTFSRRAADETGVQSMLSFRLFIEEDTLGALNLYSCRVDAFDESARAVGAILAAHAAIALTAARDRDRADTLEYALKSNREIGMAMGIVMARGLRSSEQAFDDLRRASQYLNVKLWDIAAAVVRTGELPDARR
jgi:GAF domain-containing protein